MTAFALLVSFGICEAENPFHGKVIGYFTDWTGGADTALDSWDGEELTGNELAYVFGTIEGQNVTSISKLNASSSAAESGLENIQPDSNGTGKRWEIMQPAYYFGTVDPDMNGVIWFDTSQP